MADETVRLTFEVELERYQVSEGSTHVPTHHLGLAVVRQLLGLPPLNYGDVRFKVKTAKVVDENPTPFQIDGGEHVATLKEAKERATYKITWTLPTRERMRMVRETYDGTDVWVYLPIEDEINEGLRERGLPPMDEMGR